MKRLGRLTAPVAILMAGLVAVDARMSAASDPKAVVAAYARYTILLIEVDSAERSGSGGDHFPGAAYALNARGRVIRVLNDAGHEGLAPGDFALDIPQYTRGPLGMSGWQGTYVEAGQRYLILSDPKHEWRAMVQEPFRAILITDKEDVVADMELVLACAGQPTPEQALSVSAAIRGAVKPRSWLVASYASALLAAGPASDTAVLSQAIESSAGTAFSDLAKSGLLGSLLERLKGIEKPPDSLVHLFVTMVARYLADAPDHPDPSEPDIRVSILGNHIPWILGSDRAKAVLETELPAALAVRFRKRALELTGNGVFPVEDREELKRAAELVKAPAR
jgi:hypothetical protein